MTLLFEQPSRRRRLWLGLVLVVASCRCPSAATLEPALEPLRIGEAVVFPDTFVGFSTRRAVSITNPGRSAREVRLFTTPPFSSTASATVSGGETLELEVTFAPTLPGLASGTLEVRDDEASLTSTVALSGQALEVPSCRPPNACVTSRFDVSASGCVETPLADGTSCATPLACFTTASCVSGECRGAAVTCDDGNPCTLDVCSELGCGQVDATPFCPTSSNPCLVPTCAVDAGCGFVEAPDGTACGERTCTAALVCISGACVTRTPPRNQSCVDLLVGVPAGNGTNDGRGVDARFGGIRSIAAQGSDLLLVDGTRLRRVTANGLVSSVAGVVNEPGLVDGYGQTVRVGASAQLAPSTRPGTFFLGDATTVRLASLQGSVGTLAGSPDAGGRVDGVGAAARLSVSSPMTLAAGRARFLQHERVTSFGTHVFLRDVSLSGEVRTLADLDVASFVDFDPNVRWAVSGRVVDAVGRLEVLLEAVPLASSTPPLSWSVAVSPDGGVTARRRSTTDFAWERGGLGLALESCRVTFVSDAGRTAARFGCGPVGFDGDGGLWASNTTTLEHLSLADRHTVAGPIPERALIDGARDAGRLSWPRALSPPYAEGVYFIDSTATSWSTRLFGGGRVQTVDAGAFFDATSLAAVGSTLWVMSASGTATLVDRPTLGRIGSVRVPSAAGLGLITSNGVELRVLDGTRLSTVFPDGGSSVITAFSRTSLFAAGPNGTWVVLGEVNPMASSQRLFLVDASGVVSVLAGAPGLDSERDGPAAQAGVGRPGALAVATDGTVYWSSPTTNRIRQLRNGQVSTLIELSDTVLGLSASSDGTLLVAVDAALLRVVP